MESNLKTKSELFAWSDGRRIVDLQELAKQLHCKQCSSLLDLQRTEREARYGLASVLYIHCTCGLLNDVHTSKLQQNSGESRKTPLFEINIKLKASINVLMCGGGSDSQTLSFLALLDIPVPPLSDASLVVPVADEASITPPVPSSAVSAATTSTAYAMCSSTLLTRTASSRSTLSSSATPPLVFSVPQVLASVSNDSCTSAVQESVSDENSVSDDDDQREYDNPRHDVSDEEEDGNDDRVCTDGDDEEYIPPAKVKPRSKPKPSPARKRKPAPRKSKNASAKFPAKKTKLRGKTKTPKIILKNIALESGTKEEGEDVKDASEEEEEDPGRHGSIEDIDNPMEWSSAESEHDSAGEKDSDNAFHEEEQLSKDEDEPRPKRKRGRPRGSTNRAKHKQGRKSGGNVRKDSAEPAGTQGPAGEEKEVPSCTACAKEFNSVKGYNVHMKKVHNQDMKGVPKRGDSTPEVEAATAEPVTAEIYVCNFCNQPFARDYTVLSHIKHKHWSPTLQPQECYVTLNLGSTILKMPAKKAKVHGLFTCLLCSSTMTREPMAGHICIGLDGALTCVNTCPEGKKLLYLEMNYLFTDKQGYLCDTCGDVFKVPVHLDTHLLKVHGVMTERHKRCQCHICGTTFSLPSHVKKHVLHKHAQAPDSQAPCPRPPTFMCDLCGKAYDRLDSLMVHRRRHHTEGKRFQCEHCPKKFFGRSHWLNHTRQHFGASKHVCRWCSQQFSSSYALKVHQRKHTGEKPYQCNLCDACFAQKTSLTVHMKKHQKTDTGGGGGTGRRRTGDSSAGKSSSGGSGRKEAEDLSRPGQEASGMKKWKVVGGGHVERSGASRQKKWGGSGRGGLEVGVTTVLSHAQVPRQKETSAETWSGPGLAGMVDPSTSLTLDQAGQGKADQDYRAMPMSVHRPDRGPVDEPADRHVVMDANNSLSRSSRPQCGAQAVARLSVPPPARPDTRAGHDMMDMVDASAPSARLPLPPPPPPPPPSLPPPPHSTDSSEDLSLEVRRQDFRESEGVKYGNKAVNFPCLERGRLVPEAAWPSSSQGFVQSHPVDGRRPEALSRGGRVLEDARSAPGQGPTDGGQLSSLGAGGSGQAVFPSFSYPGSSFYY